MKKPFITLFLPLLIASGLIYAFGFDMFKTKKKPTNLSSPEDIQKRSARLKQDLEMLAGKIGERNLHHYPKFVEAADWIEKSFREMGYEVRRQTYQVHQKDCWNLEVEIKGSTQSNEIIVIGAHYDAVIGSPAANDNGTGVVCLLELARHFSKSKPARTVRFVAFANEEPPYFQTDDMGSLVYAKECKKQGDNIVGMISLETMGYYSDEKDSQHYPPIFKPFYPSTGNFIGFVANTTSKSFLTKVTDLFEKHSDFPLESVASYETIPGIGWSDQWAFWKQGYEGIMVTDTATFRYPHYHTAEDTPDKIHYDRMAKVVDGLEKAISDLIQQQ
jgi:Zn-dependent M28 family amino/carboxypeptidase